MKKGSFPKTSVLGKQPEIYGLVLKLILFQRPPLAIILIKCYYKIINKF
jgi:hypothetical protein